MLSASAAGSGDSAGSTLSLGGGFVDGGAVDRAQDVPAAMATRATSFVTMPRVSGADSDQEGGGIRTQKLPAFGPGGTEISRDRTEASTNRRVRAEASLHPEQ